MALSRPARIFNQAPTVANFKKLAHAKPAEAASWIQSFGGRDDLPQRLVQGLQDARSNTNLTVAEKLKKMEKLLDTHHASIDRAIKAAIKADEVSPAELGWSTAVAEPQIVQGKLVDAAEGLALATSKGTFTITSHSTGSLATRDISTFLGSPVSIRGFLESKSTGPGKALTPVEWTPGKHRDFVSGRVESNGGKIGIRVDPDKFVEITNRDFKALLENWVKVGLSFAGEVKQIGKRWVFQGAQPKEVHMLVSLGDAPVGGNRQYTQAITPSVNTSNTPTTIIGPRVDTQGYVRRFIAGRIVPDPNNRVPPRGFEMSKAWKPIGGTIGASQSSGLEFSPVMDRAGEL